MNIKEIIYKIIGKFERKKDNHQEQLEEQVNSFENSKELILDDGNKKHQTKKQKTDIVEIKPVEDEEKLRYLSEIKTRIYCNKIGDNFIEEINASKILSEYEKTIILLVICEKNNMLKRAKQLKDNGKFDREDQRKQINKIVERIKSNKIKNFNLDRYDTVLRWKIDEELLKKYNEEINNQQENEQEEYQVLNQNDDNIEKEQDCIDQQVFIENDEEMNLKLDKQQSKELKEDLSEKNNKEDIIEIDERIIGKGRKVKNTEVSNKADRVLEYLRQKRIEVYIRTSTTDIDARMKAIKQLDIMQELIEKVEKTRQDSEYINHMYEKVNRLKKIEEKQNGESR